MLKVTTPRLEIPKFMGDDLDEWIAQCEYFFELYEMSEMNKTIQTVASFKSEVGS
jgi:hypothetical protein